jgi:hypothetical protein
MALLDSAGAVAGTSILSRVNDWTVYVHEDGQVRFCFASAYPKAAEPASAVREGVAVFVSAWPKQGVKSELSVKLGQPLRKSSDVTAIVGNASFRLFPAADRAFVNDPTEELKLIEAMKKGSSLVVLSTPAIGAATQHTFSLSGLTNALQTLATGCP